MISVARKNLFADKLRLAISVGGVAFSILLILVMLSLYHGWSKKIVSFIEESPIDYWVAQEGTPDFFRSISILPESLRETIADREGVENIAALAARQTTVQNRDHARILLFGYETDRNLGGPLRIIEGASKPQDGEIIIDKIFERKHSAHIGDSLRVSGKDLRVVGISEGGNMIISQFAFVTLKTAREVFGMEGVVNFILVETSEQSSSMESRLEDAPGSKLDALPRAIFAANNRVEVNEPFLPIVSVLTILSLFVGAMVVGLTIYTATIEHFREYAILKAVGARQWYLYRIVFEQAFIASALGIILGIILALIFIFTIPNFVTQFVSFIRMIDIIWVAATMILMSLLAAFLPTRRLASMDPSIAFRA